MARTSGLRAKRGVLAALVLAGGLCCLKSTPPAKPVEAAPVAAAPAQPTPPAPQEPKLIPGARGRDLPRIDVHTHISPDGVERALALMDEWGITGMINLSGMYPGPPRFALETQLEAAKKAHGRIAVFANVDFVRTVRQHKTDYGAVMAKQLEAAKAAGAVGLKIPKGLGLGYPRADFKDLMPVDDPGLDPLFEKAGQLNMPVAIHTGDPRAFWQPANPKNERWDELQAHPEWAFTGESPASKPWPSWEVLYKQFERRVARHPKTKFIGVHFGNAPEDPDLVSRMLTKYPNLYVDTAARVPEIGRHDAEKMRKFFETFQDRILFGTDTGIGETQEEMMYGSNGANAPTRQDEERFFLATWQYFETRDRQFDHPSPIQGRWKIDGLGLSDAILRKVYFENAARLVGWKPTGN